MCSPGKYCPTGSWYELDCPAGSYQPSYGMGASADCLMCGAGSFNPMSGQSGCLPCGASSYSLTGATQCICNGTNRAFQFSDGNCICQPRYVFYSDSLTISNEDSSIDCQPIVFDRCSSTQVRKMDGSCVSTSYDCASECKYGGGSGTINWNTGICECAQLQDADTVCDETCRATQLQVHYDPTAQSLMMYDPVSSTSISSFNATTMPGEISCRALRAVGSLSSPTCRFFVTQCLSTGMRGVYDPSQTYLSGVLPGTRNTTSSISSRSFYLAGVGVGTVSPRSGSSSSTPSGIDQPVVCLQNGEGMLWSISSDRLHYPVYQKDSLFNNNPLFDYSAFTQLAANLKDPSTNIATFAFTFNDAGVYVFADAADNSQIQMISVLGANQNCPNGEARYMALTAASAASVGGSRTNNILLSPDWLLIAILLVGLVVLIGGLIGGLYYFRSKSWGKDSAFEPEYRKQAQQHDFDKFASKGTATTKLAKYQLVGAKPSDAAAAGPDGKEVVSTDRRAAGAVDDKTHDLEAFADDFWDFERQVDLEAFDVRFVYEKLEAHSQQIEDKLGKAQEHARDLCMKMLEETESIKALLGSRLGRNRGRVSEQLKNKKQQQNKKWQVVPGGVEVGEDGEPHIPSTEIMKTMLEEELHNREYFARRQRLECDEITALRERIANYIADNGFAGITDPDSDLNKLAAELDDRVHAIRRGAEKERIRRMEAEDTLREELGDDVVDVFTASVRDRDRRTAEETLLRSAETGRDALKSSVGKLRTYEEQYEKAAARCEARGDTEGRSRLDKERSFDTMSMQKAVGQALSVFETAFEESRGVMAAQFDLSDPSCLSLRKGAMSAVEPAIEAEHALREKHAKQTYDLPSEFADAMTQFIGRTLHEMKLLNDEQLARVLSGDKQGTLVDSELIRKVVEARKDGVAIHFGNESPMLEVAAGGGAGGQRTGTVLAAGTGAAAAAGVAGDAGDGTAGSHSQLSSEQQQRLDELEKNLATRRLDLQEIHQQERRQAEDELAAEEREQAKVQAERVSSMLTSANEALAEAHKSRLDACSTDVEKKRLLEVFAQEKRGLEEALDVEISRQQQRMKQNLEARRARKLKHLKEKQVAEASIEEATARRERDLILAVAGATNSGGAGLESVVTQHLEEKQELLSESHKAERQDLTQSLAEEDSRETASVEEFCAMMASTREAALVQRRDADLARLKQQRNMSEQQKQSESHRILSAYEEERSRMLEAIEMDKKRQIEAVQKRLLERKTRKLESMNIRQSSEIDRELKKTETVLQELLVEHQETAEHLETSLSLEWQRQKEQMQRQLQVRAAKRRQKTEEEKISIQRELTAELQETKEVVEQQLSRQFQIQKKILEQRAEQDLQQMHTETEKKRLLEEFNKQVESLEGNIVAERKRQLEEAQKAVDAKRVRKERELKRKQLAEEERFLAEQAAAVQRVSLVSPGAGRTGDATSAASSLGASLSESGAVADGAGAGVVVLLPPTVDVEAEIMRKLEEQRSRLEKQHQRQLEEMEKQHLGEKEKLLADLDAELRREREKEGKRIEDSKRKKLAEEKAKLTAHVEAELSAVQEEQEAQIILQRHEAEVAKLVSTIESEKERQHDDLNRRLEERRKKKMAEVAARQVEQKVREQQLQSQEADEMKRRVAVETEKSALGEAIAQGTISNQEIEKAIEVTMQQRHARETTELIDRQQQERDQQLRLAIWKVRSVSDPTLDSSTIDLQRLQDDNERDELLTASSELDVSYARDRLTLRQRQLDEIAEACTDLSPQETILRAQGVEAARRAADLRALQEKLEAERSAAKQAFDQQREEMERAQREATEREIAELESRFVAERDKVEAELEASRVAKQKQLEEIRQKRHAQLEAELKHVAEADQKNAILDRFRTEQVELEQAMSVERERQEKAIRERLKKRQTDRVKQKRAEMEREAEQRRRLAEEEAQRAREVERIASEREQFRKQTEEEERRRAERMAAKRQQEASAVAAALVVAEQKAAHGPQHGRQQSEAAVTSDSSTSAISAASAAGSTSSAPAVAVEVAAAPAAVGSASTGSTALLDPAVEGDSRANTAAPKGRGTVTFQDASTAMSAPSSPREPLPTAEPAVSIAAAESPSSPTALRSSSPVPEASVPDAASEYASEQHWWDALKSSPLWNKLLGMDAALQTLVSHSASRLRSGQAAADGLSDILKQLKRGEATGQSLDQALASSKKAAADLGAESALMEDAIRLDRQISARNYSRLKISAPESLSAVEAAAYAVIVDLFGERRIHKLLIADELPPTLEGDAAGGLLSHSFTIRSMERKELVVHRAFLQDMSQLCLLVTVALSQLESVSLDVALRESLVLMSQKLVSNAVVTDSPHADRHGQPEHRGELLRRLSSFRSIVSDDPSLAALLDAAATPSLDPNSGRSLSPSATDSRLPPDSLVLAGVAGPHTPPSPAAAVGVYLHDGADSALRGYSGLLSQLQTKERDLEALIADANGRRLELSPSSGELGRLMHRHDAYHKALSNTRDRIRALLELPEEQRRHLNDQFLDELASFIGMV